MNRFIKRFFSLLLALTLVMPCLSGLNMIAWAGEEIVRVDSSFDSDLPEPNADGLEDLSVNLDEDAFHDYLVSHFAQCDSTIDISSLQIPNNNQNWNTLNNYILYGLPESYHVIQFGFKTINGIYDSINVWYNLTAEEYAAEFAECERAANILLNGLQTDSLTQVEKALLVHDRLAVWNEYDRSSSNGQTIPNSSYCMYGALGLGVSVCQGYARAYMYLLRQLGIPCVLCRSSRLNHEWNIVTVNGVKYHVDVTWDDPTTDIYGRVNHNNFLNSTNGIVSTGHSASDYNTEPTDTTYDNYFWKNSQTAFQLFNGEIYFFNTMYTNLCKMVNLTSVTLLSIPVKWYGGANNTSPWTYSSVRLSSDSSHLFYSTPDKIYSYDPSSGVSTEFYTPDLPGNYIWINGFKAQENWFYLDISNKQSGNIRTDDNVIKYPYAVEPDQLTPVSNAQISIDRENGIIIGLHPAFSSADFKAQFENNAERILIDGGIVTTGCVVQLTDINGTVIDELTAVLYGDVNSDGFYDGQDATVVNCLANGLLTREQAGEAKYMAADCNHDGSVDSSDVLVLEQAGLLLSQVDQSKDDYMETDAYEEYLDLIDQNPTVDETPVDEPAEPETPAQPSLFERIVEFIRNIIAFVKSIFVK